MNDELRRGTLLYYETCDEMAGWIDTLSNIEIS